MTADKYCRKKAANSGSSFYYSLLFLPEKKRQAMFALYAFCREVDDAVDNIVDADAAQSKLKWWREQIHLTFNGQATHPIGNALQTTLQTFDLQEEYFIEIIDGMAMDLTQNEYTEFKHLALYCHRVAGVVGLLSAEIFGYQNRQTLKYAENLGIALQLINIIRDVREDAERGRIYLPQTEMAQFNVNKDEVLNLKSSPELIALLQFQAGRAKQYYQRAMQILPDSDRHAQRVGIIMAAIYRAMLTEIERNRFQVMQKRIALTTLKKLWIAWQSARYERKRYPAK